MLTEIWLEVFGWRMWLREAGESHMSCTELMQVKLLVCDDDDDEEEEEEEDRKRRRRTKIMMNLL